MKRTNSFALILCCLLPIFLAFHDEDEGGVGGALPPGAGGGGPFATTNMEFLSNLPIAAIGGGGANVNGNDCWGWTDPQDGDEYAICGLESGTAFINITDPFLPEYLGFLPSQTGTSTWRDMKTFNNHVFIVADSAGSHGMQVFDLTRLRNVNPNNPQTFNNDARYTGITSAHNIAINEDTGFAYIVGSNQANGGLHIVNINNPTNPVAVGNFGGDGYTHDAQIITYDGPDTTYVGQEIAFASNEDTLTIVNVTNKNNPSQISRNTYPQDAYSHQSWITEDHRFVYLCDELDENQFGGGSRTHIWDVQNLDSPNYLGFYSGTTAAIDHNLYIKDDLIYLANYTAGLRILELDPGSPTNLTEVASIDTFMNNNNASFNGAWSCYPFFDSGTILINDINGGMFLSRLVSVAFEYPSGRPTDIDPSGGVEFQVNITGIFGESVDPTTATLHVDRGNGGFETFPLNNIGGDAFEVDFPSSTCGTTLQYYISAETVSGQLVTDPSNAPSDVYETLSVDVIVTTFDDDAETNQGWTVSGNADDGQWNRGIPAGGGDRGDPPVDADGSGQCYLTDNVDGNSDVDGGSTILTSPILDGSEPGAILSYSRWYSNDTGGGANQDIFEVEISNNGGSSWTNLETVGPAGSETSGGWFEREYLISDVIAPTANMRIRFIASDVGQGSVVEAGVDAIRIESVECNAGPVVVTPADVTVFRGILVEGNDANLSESDDVVMGFNPGFTLTSSEAPVWVILDATLPTDDFDSLELEYESQANTPGLTATLEAFNYTTNSFDIVNTVDESFNIDTNESVDLSANLADYILPGSASIQARLGWRKTGFTILFPWEVRLDHVFWTAN